MTVDNYGIPPERAIGSAFGLHYDEASNESAPRVTSRLLRRRSGEACPDLDENRSAPLPAVGNSNGDLPMLRYDQSCRLSSLSLLVHHDDDTGRGGTPYG